MEHTYQAADALPAFLPGEWEACCERLGTEGSNHWVLPFAAAMAPECQAMIRRLELPHLLRLLELLRPDPATHWQGDADSASPPHERVVARALGLDDAASPLPDGQIPWAAAASDDPRTPQAWFTPCHFQVDLDQVRLLSPWQLLLYTAHSRDLMGALAPFCADDGVELVWEGAMRWRACGAVLRDIVGVGLDRVVGLPVGPWMRHSPANARGERLLRRLQSEAQMLFHTHAVNGARERSGLLPVNGFWIGGAGVCLRRPVGPAPVVIDALRRCALRAEWSAWRQAWADLDATVIAGLLTRARAGQPVRLTLCGERHAQSWASVPDTWGTRLRRWIGGAPPLEPLLESL